MPSPCSAETGSGSPRPRDQASPQLRLGDPPLALVGDQQDRLLLPAQLGREVLVGRGDARRARRPRTGRHRPRPGPASTASAAGRPGSPARPVSRPAVSITRNSVGPSRQTPSIRSRVTPGVSSTIACRRPTSRLNSVDLPTFGRPRIATVGRLTLVTGTRPAGRPSVRKKTVPSATAAGTVTGTAELARAQHLAGEGRDADHLALGAREQQAVADQDRPGPADLAGNPGPRDRPASPAG